MGTDRVNLERVGKSGFTFSVDGYAGDIQTPEQHIRKLHRDVQDPTSQINNGEFGEYSKRSYVKILWAVCTTPRCIKVFEGSSPRCNPDESSSWLGHGPDEFLTSGMLHPHIL